MIKVLYIEPLHNNKQYLYYTLLGKGLINQKNIKLTIGNSITNYNLNYFNLIILGYGACANSNFTSNRYILNTNTPIIAFLFKLSLDKEKKFKFLRDNRIITFGQQYRIQEFKEKFNIKILPTLYPFDNTIFKYLNLEKIYDIGMTGALHNSSHYNIGAYLKEEINIRKRIVNLLENTNYKKFIQCSDINNQAYIQNTNQYIKTINQTRIWIATSADYGDLTPRYSEIIGCQTLLFCNEQSNNTFSEYLKEGETCVFYKNDLSDLITKIDYYLNNTKLYQKITDNAYQIFNDNISCDNIVKKYLKYSR